MKPTEQETMQELTAEVNRLRKLWKEYPANSSYKRGLSKASSRLNKLKVKLAKA